MKYPKISIITPSFNQGKYIEQTIKSVISQRYPNLEYLIADGGSTDNSIKIILKYHKKYPKIIKLISKKDNGQVDAINKGINKASGKIISYINSDDFYLKDSFVKVAQYFNENPKSLWVVGNCGVTANKHKLIFFFKHLWPIHKYTLALEIFNTINQPSTFLTKNIVKKVGLFNDKYNYAFDYEYWLRCNKLMRPGRIYEKLAVFRIHENSKGSSSFVTQFTEDLEIIKNYTRNKISINLHKLIKNIAISTYKILKS